MAEKQTGIRMQRGWVKWWNENKGYGYLTIEGGDDIFFAKATLDPNTTPDFNAGETVVFEVHQGPRGTMARNVRRAKEDEMPEWRASGVIAIPMLRVYICCATGDSEIAQKIHRVLRSAGFVPLPGEGELGNVQVSEETTIKYITSAQIIIGCLSRQSVADPAFHVYIQAVMEIANQRDRRRVRFLPIRVEQCNMPPSLKDLPSIDVFKSEGIDPLVSLLRQQSKRIWGV